MPERSSLSRVRCAAPKAGAPLTAPGRSDGDLAATGGSGGKITQTRQCVAKQRWISDSPAVPRVSGAARRRPTFRCAILAVSRPAGCTPIQSSWTARCCSRKWMSGPADALTPVLTDRKLSIAALTIGFIYALQILLGSAGRSVFSLDKYLSWMSHTSVPANRCASQKISRRQARRATLSVRCGD